ncbi:MAG: hypothetical protein HN849_24935 [Victivallales bacterium]|jgi:hypothetical protein|nr:hypothetical protein [Victivallales bacterium]
MESARHFRVPLIVTGIVLVLALLLGIAGVTWVHRTETSSRRRTERAQQLGRGMALATCLVVAPFWLAAAAKVGKARRKAKEATETQEGEPE